MLPAAIQVAREMGEKINFLGARIDPGDKPIVFSHKSSPAILMRLGLQMLKIYASNDPALKHHPQLKMQKQKIDGGTNMAYDQPALLGGIQNCFC